MRIGIASGDYLSAHKSQDGKAHWGGSGWARLGQYLDKFGDSHTTVSGTLAWNRTHFSIIDDLEELVDVDVVVMQRLMHGNLAEHIKKAQAVGQHVINDLDDWYWGLDPRNDAFWSSHPKRNPNENRNHYKSVLSSSDLVIVSTAYLRDRIKDWVHCPIVVAPNTVDVNRFTPVVHDDSTVPLVGWVGATSHRSGDLETVSSIFAPMIQRGEIRFQHSGHYPHAVPVHEILKVEKTLITTKDAVDARDYPTLLDMHVGIAPLSDVPFNHAKSDIKLLEYSSSGIPWVGSALPSYDALQKEWGVGRVAKRPKDWIRHINALKDPKVRAEEGALLREKVRARHIDVGAHTLRSLIEQFS
jgi:hypothetical protein